MTQVLRGNIIQAPRLGELDIREHGYLVLEDGVIRGVYDRLPLEYATAPLVDYGQALVMQSFADMHLHAPQYPMLGMGMDLPLLDWLNTYTFRTEARFADPDFARRTYRRLASDLITNGTTRVCMFSSLHTDATLILMEELEKAGITGFVGKVNMDCNSPEFLIETTEDSLKETEKYLAEHEGSKKVKTILAPRFAPTCSKPLIDGLGKLAAKYHCGVHTHLVESLWEAQEALNLFPGYSSDAEIYERAGLMDHGPSIFAHVIFPTEEDKRILKKHGSFSVHCPDATVNIIAGIMPLQHMEAEGLKIAMGTDIAGGHGIGIYRQVARAVQLSKLKEFYEPQESKTITITQAFYHATKESGSVFGKVGSFEKGYAFNALVIDNMEDPWTKMTAEEKLERFCYIGDDRNIKARYIDGELLEQEF